MEAKELITVRTGDAKIKPIGHTTGKVGGRDADAKGLPTKDKVNETRMA